MRHLWRPDRLMRAANNNDIVCPALLADFIPTEMAVSARKLIALPTVGVAGATPITSTHPLVEIGIITADGTGTACPIINWSGGPQPDFGAL